jgi:hypothetical protein
MSEILVKWRDSGAPPSGDGFSPAQRLETALWRHLILKYEFLCFADPVEDDYQNQYDPEHEEKEETRVPG